MGDLNSLVKKLREADILLVSEKGVKHAVNRALGRSRWHHVMLYLGKGEVLEVTPKKGCHISKIDLSKGCYKGYKAIRCKRISATEGKEIAATSVKIFCGQKFSVPQLIKVFFRKAFDWRSNGNRKLACGPAYRCKTESMICSNSVAMAYYVSGHLISDKYVPEYIVPRDYDKAKGFEIIFDINREN